MNTGSAIILILRQPHKKVLIYCMTQTLDEKYNSSLTKKQTLKNYVYIFHRNVKNKIHLISIPNGLLFLE